MSCQGFLSVATKSEEMTQSRYVVVVGSERGPSHGSLKSRRTVRALTRLLQRERATKEARAKKDFFFKTGHDELRRFGSFGQGEVVALPPSLPAFFPLFPSPPLADSVFNRPFSLQSRPFRLFFFPRLAQCSSH